MLGAPEELPGAPEERPGAPEERPGAPEERPGAPKERTLVKEKERGEKFVGEKLTEDIESRLEVPLDVQE